jgi:outer membrane protein assembly factor BamB
MTLLAMTLLTSTATMTGCATGGSQWAQWGGPNGDFTIDAPTLAESWPETGPPKLWSRELGPGYSAITVDDGVLYTAFRRSDDDVITALDAQSGATLWEYAYVSKPYGDEDNEVRLDFGTGPNGTPLVLDDRVIATSFSAVVTCVDRHTGAHLWSHDLVNEYGGKIQQFGYSISPILHNGNVLLLVGGDKHGLMAFDPDDGAVAWTSPPYDISYASPKIINVDGLEQIAFLSSEEVIGIDARDGRKLWSHPCANQYKNNATPLIYLPEHRLLWAATQTDGGTRVLKLTRNGDNTSAEQVWFNDKVKIFHWNAVPMGDVVLASIGSDVTFLSAVDIHTGEVLWRERGFHKANGLLANGDTWIFLDEDGSLAMAKPTREAANLLASVPLTVKVSWTVPTLVGTTLYVRDQERIMAMDLSPGS